MPTDSPADSSSIIRGARPWLALTLAFGLIGCGAMPPASERAVERGAGGLVGKPPTPEWRDSRGREESERAGGVASPAGLGSPLYSRQPEPLAREVALVCARARAEGRGPERFLRTLVADLYFSEVPPGMATKALLDGDCGSPAGIVEEMVARGGDDSLEAVLSQSRRGPEGGQARQLDSAVAAGLARHADLSEVTSDARPDEPTGYGMLYFPSVGASSQLVTSVALNRLYEEALPGYGIYTFVLMGSASENPSGHDLASYGELFRTIETYVSAGDGASDVPNPETHVFLVPVKPGDAGAPLIDQSASDLSDLMRRHFSRALRHEGHQRLAARLDKGAGPFLVAALEPRLLPSSSDSPRLVTDLSGIGPEHIYGVVDAFDRAIPPETSGRPESLSLIRKRLLGLPVSPSDRRGASPDGKSWVFMLGPMAARPVADRSSLS
ncbi:hypothetical protein [Thiocystis violacea]|uniref:hypothetical protein n=1 Tax=Thiocystis violacea TaxID=13725 RepID=UPI0019086C79|nr:hypothetical protein [Thiocystis violacea]